MRSILLDVGRKAVFSMLVGLAVIAASAGGFITRAANFNHLDRTLLAEYRVLGRDRVPLVIAAQPARMVEVVKVIGAPGRARARQVTRSRPRRMSASKQTT